MNLTSKKSRRQSLRGAAAVVSMASAAPNAPYDPDSALLALCAEWHDTNRSCHEAGILEEQMVALSDTANEIMRKIASIPALSMPGILAKLAVLAHEQNVIHQSRR